MENQKSFEQIELYLRRQLPKSERDAFEYKLSTDNSLREALARQLEAENAIRLYRNEQLEIKLRQRSLKLLRRQKNLPKLFIAILMLLLFLAIYFGLASGLGASKSTDPVLEQIIALVDNTPPPRFGTLGDVQLSWIDALKRYDQQDYAKAIEKFHFFLQQEGMEFLHKTNEANLYMGYCYLQLKKWQDAVTQLQLIPPEASDLYVEGQWLLALAFLSQEERRTEGIEQLYSITINPIHPARQRALLLLNELETFSN